MTDSERRALAREAARLGAPLDDEALNRLGVYVDLLRVWNKRIRLVGDRDPESLVLKHLPDCLALIPLIPTQGPVADIGSGAGLPGLALACARPGLAVWLIESRRRRASFLLEAKALMGLAEVQVLNSRAEDLASRPDFAEKASAVTGRALALEDLIRLGLPLLSSAGRFLVMQSQRAPLDRIEAVATRASLDVLEVREYRLAGGEARRIVLLARP